MGQAHQGRSGDPFLLMLLPMPYVTSPSDAHF